MTAGKRLLAAPSLPWEVGNALVALLRRRRLDAGDMTKAWRSFERVPVRYVDVDVPASLRTAAEHGIYAYDAYVIEAARAASAPLLTLDRRMAGAARGAGVTLVEVAE